MYYWLVFTLRRLEILDVSSRCWSYGSVAYTMGIREVSSASSAVVCVVPLSAGLSINTLEDDRLQEIGHNLLRSAHRILCNSVLLGTCVLEVLVVSTRFGLTVLDL